MNDEYRVFVIGDDGVSDSDRAMVSMMVALFDGNFYC